MATVQTRIRDDQHEALTGMKSDLATDLRISTLVQAAVDLFLAKHRLNALILKAHRASTVDEKNRILREEIGELLEIPKEYFEA